MHLHSLVLHASDRGDQEYVLLAHVSFCQDGETYTITNEQIVGGLDKEYEASAAIDVLTSIAVELVKTEMLHGLLERTEATLNL